MPEHIFTSHSLQRLHELTSSAIIEERPATAGEKQQAIGIGIPGLSFRVLRHNTGIIRCPSIAVPNRGSVMGVPGSGLIMFGGNMSSWCVTYCAFSVLISRAKIRSMISATIFLFYELH